MMTRHKRVETTILAVFTRLMRNRTYNEIPQEKNFLIINETQPYQVKDAAEESTKTQKVMRTYLARPAVNTGFAAQSLLRLRSSPYIPVGAFAVPGVAAHPCTLDCGIPAADGLAR